MSIGNWGKILLSRLSIVLIAFYYLSNIIFHFFNIGYNFTLLEVLGNKLIVTTIVIQQIYLPVIN